MESDRGFRLIETMRGTGAGEVYLLDRHLERLSASARHFHFICDIETIRGEILRAAQCVREAARLRLTLGDDGRFDIDVAPLPAGDLQKLAVSRVRVNSGNVLLYHKTTRREIYEEARRECSAGTDAILVNERSEITETTIMNVAVFRGGRWITPSVSCGLLPGAMRAELLARGEIIEGVIHVDELRDGERIRCFNALRGVLDLPLERSCAVTGV